MWLRLLFFWKSFKLAIRDMMEFFYLSEALLNFICKAMNFIHLHGVRILHFSLQDEKSLHTFEWNWNATDSSDSINASILRQNSIEWMKDDDEFWRVKRANIWINFFLRFFITAIYHPRLNSVVARTTCHGYLIHTQRVVKVESSIPERTAHGTWLSYSYPVSVW